jgi:hypothetical protein
VALAASLATPLAGAWLGGWAALLPVAALAGVGLVCAGDRLLPRRWWPLPGIAGARGRPLAAALACQGAFFVLAAGLLWLLAAIVSKVPGATPGPLLCLSALALAWAAGFVVPGSSAGLGVREAVLIVALESALGAEASTVVALALRLVTTAGDGVFCALALLLPLPQRSCTGATAVDQSKKTSSLTSI